MGKLHTLAQQEFSDISIEDWITLFDWARECGPAMQLPAPDSPIDDDMYVFQYWNDTPDEQVAKLLSMTRSVCEADDIKWRLFNEDEAIEFIRSEYGQRYVTAFENCFHQAIKSDLLRYLYMSVNGGLWLDADLVLKASPRSLMSLGSPVVVQRNAKNGQLTSWLIVAPAHDPVIKHTADIAMSNLENVAFLENARRAKQGFGVAGPPVLRQAVACSIHASLVAGLPAPKVGVIDEVLQDQLLQSGQSALQEPLKYKSTDRAWQVWGQQPKDGLREKLQKFKGKFFR